MCFGFFLGSRGGRRSSTLCGIVIGADGAGIQIVKLDGFDTYNILKQEENENKKDSVCESWLKLQKFTLMIFYSNGIQNILQLLTFSIKYLAFRYSSFLSTYSDRIRVGHGVSTGHEILLGFVGIKLDREDTWLHLCNIRNVVGGNPVFSLCSGYNDGFNLGTVVDRLVRDTEVERDRVGGLRRFAAEASESSAGGGLGKCLGDS